MIVVTTYIPVASGEQGLNIMDYGAGLLWGMVSTT